MRIRCLLLGHRWRRILGALFQCERCGYEAEGALFSDGAMPPCRAERRRATLRKASSTTVGIGIEERVAARLKGKR